MQDVRSMPNLRTIDYESLDTVFNGLAEECVVPEFSSASLIPYEWEGDASCGLSESFKQFYILKLGNEMILSNMYNVNRS